MNIRLLTQVLPYPPESRPKVKTDDVLDLLSERHSVTLVPFVCGGLSDEVRYLQPYCRTIHALPMARA